MKGRKSTFKNIAKLFVAVIVTLVIFIANHTVFNSTKNLQTENNLAAHGKNDKYYLDVMTYNGVQVDKIYFSGDRSNYGWCVNRGAALQGGMGNVSAVKNGFEDNNAKAGYSGSLQWLFDNIYRAGNEVSDEEKTFFREYLKQIANVDINGYSENDIFAYEQFAIWNLTNNVSNPSYPTSNGLYSSLINKAKNENINYTHTEQSVTVNTTNVRALENGAIGPFYINVNGPAKLWSNVGKLYKSSALSEDNVLSDYVDKYSGEVYLKVAEGSNVKPMISWTYYTTTVKKYETEKNGAGVQQPFIMIYREKQSSHTGDYQISIGKKNSKTGAYVSGATLNTRFNNDDTGRGEANGARIDVTTVAQKLYLNSSVEWSNNQNGIIDIRTDVADVYAFAETSAPEGYKPNIYNDYICIEVLKEINSSTSNIKGINLFRGASRGGERLNQTMLQASNTNKTWYIQYNNDTLSLSETKPDISILVGEITLGANGTGIDFNFYNEIMEGNFDINLVKYLEGTTQKLNGAEFTVKVEKYENGSVVGNPILNETKTTEGEDSEKGRINISGVPIAKEGETYKVTLTETKAPAGYIGLNGAIEFFVQTELKNGKYVLVSKPANTAIANAKKVEVKANEILVEAENRVTSIDIHKGVKTVENQSSGYYEIPETTYTDDRTGDTYTEIGLDKVIHDWVIETTIPEDVSKYAKYMVTDNVDITKLLYVGVKKVELVGQNNEVTTLTENTDYKIDYVPEIGKLTITYINKKNGYDFIGNFLKNDGLGNCKIRVTFNTRFKKNENGKLAVLDGAVSNAENRARLDYDTGNGIDLWDYSEEPEIHTGAVSVFKYEDKNGNKKHDPNENALVGAVFKIAETEDDARNNKFLKINGKEVVAITNEHGIATFTGLEFGNDAISNEANLETDKITGASVYKYNWENASKDYYIVETKAPEGYSLLNEVIKVTVSKNSTQIIDLTEKINSMEPIGNTPLEFDLALRKSIYSVNHNGVVTNPNPIRLPSFNASSYTRLIQDKTNGSEQYDRTAAYFHTKKAVEVQTGDIVTYRIYVFNEADLKGYATKITDYLPEGLEFIPANQSTVNAQNEWTIAETANGITKIETTKLANTRLNECGLSNYLIGNDSGDWYAYVDVECRVTKNPTEETIYLTNRAEISEDKAVIVDSNNVEKEIDVEDRDSQPGNTKANHERDMLNYDDSVDYNTNTYYEGYQDDDDKETVTIARAKHYNFVINKVDEKGQPLDSTRFTINKEVEGTYVNEFTGIVDGTKTIKEPSLANEYDVEINKTYTYKIIENMSKNGYENLLEGKYIVVKTYMNENKQMCRGAYDDDDENSYFNMYGFEIYNNDNTKVLNTETDLYEKIEFMPEQTTTLGVYPPSVSIKIPNEKILTGRYKLVLRKINEEDASIGGVSFSINGETKQTPAVGDITITDENVNEGYVAINKSNYATADSYVIQEINDAGSAGYIIIKDAINLSVTKALDAAAEEYYVSKITVNYTNNLGEEETKELALNSVSERGYLNIDDVATAGNGKTNVILRADGDGKITIIAKNTRKTGEYDIQLQKVDQDNNGMARIKFMVAGQTLETNNGGFTNKINKTITKDNVNVDDIVEIQELADANGRVVELKNPIVLKVAKRELATRYMIDTIQISEKNTSNVSAVSSGAGSITLSNVAINDDSGRTVNITAHISGSLVSMKIENKKPVGEFSIKIKKTNTTTGNAINGISFSVKDEEQHVSSVTTANVASEDGIAYVETNKAITKAQSYIYLIQEQDLPASITNLMAIKDYGLELRFNTVYSEAKKKYVVDKNSVTGRVIALSATSTPEQNERQKAIMESVAENITIDEDSQTIEIPIANENVATYNLGIKKVDIEDNTNLAGAKFTIYENGKLIKQNDYLGASETDTNGYSILKEGIPVNSTYVYDIYETEPAEGSPRGYINIFEKTYIHLTVTVGNDGTVGTPAYEIKAKAGLGEAEAASAIAETQTHIQEYIDNNSTNFIVSNGANGYILNIPNIMEPEVPVKFYVSLHKESAGQPLSGAELQLKVNEVPGEIAEVTKQITGSSSETDRILVEILDGQVRTFEITESSTVKGYKNILKNKKLVYTIKNDAGRIFILSRKIYDTANGGAEVTGQDYIDIIKHISVSRYADKVQIDDDTEEDVLGFRVYIDNPYSYNFTLKKQDIGGNELSGAKFMVKSSHSGIRYFNAGNSWDIQELNVRSGEEIEYEITEIETVEDSVYVNKFENPVKVKVKMLNGNLSIVSQDTAKYFNCYITPASANDLAEGEEQRLVVELKNPPRIEVELLKTTTKETNPSSVSGARFEIKSIDTADEVKRTMQSNTDEEGKINFAEEISIPGNYKIRVSEVSAASQKYINVLENKYMNININVAANGVITVGDITFYQKGEGDSYTLITGAEATKLAEYCTAVVDEAKTNKLNIQIKDPLQYKLTVLKQKTNRTALKDVTFDITSTSNGTVTKTTDVNGKINLTEEWINPGVYEYKISEVSVPEAQYSNVLQIYNKETNTTDKYKIVAYIKVNEAGEVSSVADIAGNEFSGSVAMNRRFYVQKEDGTPASSEVSEFIHDYCKIMVNNNINEPDEVVFTIENPVKLRLNIIKKQLDANGQELDLAGAKFTVTKNDYETLLNNEEVTSEVELEEQYLSNRNDYYDIYENSTATSGSYVNILKNKFIRVYTNISAEGKLTIKNNEGNESSNEYGDNHSYYFEIFEKTNAGTETKLDRDANKELYESVYVEATKNENNIYTLNVKVINPITINVGVVKKQVGATGMPVSGVALKVISDITGNHDITSAPYETVFSEGNVKPGTYNFVIKELNNPDKKYTNILKDRYAKANITISKEGSITVNGVDYYADNGNNDYTDDTQIVNTDIITMLNEHVHVTADAVVTNKLCIEILNPVSMDIELSKVDENGNSLEGANFNATKYLADNEDALTTIQGQTASDGKLTLENSDIITPGIYRYEVKELASAGKQYVNILDSFEDGNKYKIVFYVKLNASGKTEFVKDGEGTAFADNEIDKYFIRNVEDNSEAPANVKRYIRKHVKLLKASEENQKDKISLTVENTVKIDIDIIKTTITNGVRENLYGTVFSACMDDSKVVFKEITADTDIEHRLKNVEPGNHIFYITENSSAADVGFVNILEDRYIKVYANIASDGTLKIKDNNGNDSEHYFEIYEGRYDAPSNSKMLDRAKFADIYSKVNVSAAKQTTSANNGVYKLNVEVENPETHYKLTINKKVFGREDINIEGTEFYIARKRLDSAFENLLIAKTDAEGNLVMDEKRVLPGIVEYYITETKPAGSEFINVLEHNYIKVIVRINSDGTIQIIDSNGSPIGNENRYYILDEERQNIINPKDTVVDEYIRVSATNAREIPELNIEVKNPQYYNFKLIKKDIDTDQAMNGVKFTLKVYGASEHSPLQEVNLIDANTLEPLDIKEVTTANVDGVDGVISIPNILIDKTGTYTFVFHEETTDGIFSVLYKSPAEDIGVNIDITVDDRADEKGKEYKISTPRISTGAKYVDLVETISTKAQTVSTGVTNERIKGSYNLKLTKLDKVTGVKLDGAKFNVTVKKGAEDYNLYRATDNVEAKDVIIPNNYTVVNGELVINNIRIDAPETYTIILTETKAPNGYMLLDVPIELQVTTERDGAYDDEKYVLKEVKLVGGNNHSLVTVSNTEEEINVVAKDEYFDLALRKSITSVSYSDSEDGKITEDKTKDRVPEYAVSDALFTNDATTAGYKHVKNHVRAYVGQEVIFTLRVYNEGEIDGYAEEITDHLPEGLEFVDDEFNRQRGWQLDESDTSRRTVKTTYLSKENNPNNDRFNSENNLIMAVDNQAGVIDYKEIEIKCKISKGVTARTVLTNIAEISLSKANNRTAETVDRDSHTTPGAEIPATAQGMQDYKEDELTDDRNTYVPGQEDDDDFEKIVVEEFDLALRKYITAVNNEEILAVKTEEKYTSGDTKEGTKDVNNVVKYEREPRVNVSTLKEGTSTTATYTHTKEPLEVAVGDVVTYNIEVFNEGTVDGYASLIKDDIPEGVEFVAYKEGDGSVNDIYRWKMVDENDNEVSDPKKAKYIVSDYLSKDNEKNGNSNMLKAFDPKTGTSLDSKYVQVQFKVICKQDYSKIITNYAQIAEDTDENGGDVFDRDSTPNEWIDNKNHKDDDQDVEHIKVTYMDLALRKFITGVTDAKTGVTQEVTTRIPKVDPTALKDEKGTTAEYKHTKEPVLVHTNDVVIYTLRIFNEGSRDGYATQIKDDLPEGLVFLPNHEINKQYEWMLVDENDKPVTDMKYAKYAVTNYLSKEKETKDRNNLIEAYEKADGTKLQTPAYKEVKIAFKVTEPQTSDRILTNYAQISSQTDEKGKHREDRDSTPNKWLNEDDEDYEKVKVQYFDLALRKWVTKAIVVQNGKEEVHETGHHAEDDPEDVVKVDLKKSKIDSVVVKFEYQVRITNEGQIEGYAKEIKDYIPEGLRFDPADNPTWTQEGENVIVTEQLKDTLLKPGESAEVTVVLTWINSKANLGLKVNIAEISKDYNDYGTPDIDSTPNNFKTGEDDIDDAPVMLSVKTGNQNILYVMFVVGIGAIMLMIIRRKQKKK